MDELDWERPNQADSPELHAGGWASGGYVQTCGACGKGHIADKRASRCVACAKAAFAVSRQAAAEMSAQL